MRYALVLMLCIGFSPLANAQQRGGYVGISGGAFTFEDDEAGISASDVAWSYGLFGGYRFSNSFAIEGGWEKTTDFSDLFDDILQQLPIIGSFLAETHAEYEIVTVRALGIAQLHRFELFGGLGYHDSDADATVTVGRTIVDLDASDSGATAVAGAQLDGKRFSYRIQYEWFDADDRLDLSNLAFGWLIRF